MSSMPGDDSAETRQQRREMVEEVAAMAESLRHETGGKAMSSAVLAALGRVQRHRFVDAAMQYAAYDNRPLPIGQDQTISQPYIVALMTDLLHLPPHAAVLEVGTGSGYQAAVLAELGARVYSIEIVAPLAQHAQQTLQQLGYDSVEVRAGDGYAGWPEHAPFDAVIVTAGARHVPPALFEQLKPGGRMVIPVGEPYRVQELWLIEKTADGGEARRVVTEVRFVPLTGNHWLRG